VTDRYERILSDNLREYGEGTRHLAFLGQLYTDRTHFLFELLQNAEDAGATKIRFHLYHDRLEVRHNGRPFTEQDVRGVCGVGVGTKAADLTKIGKFGVGFKSVYAYTASPAIHSGDEHFHILHYVRPYVTAPQDPGIPWTTLFIFPFDHPGIPARMATDEIGHRLEHLGVRTLLFLRRLEALMWEIDDGRKGLYRREDHGAAETHRRVRVLTQVGATVHAEDWLVFERAVLLAEDATPGRVEIAYRLSIDDTTGDEMIVRTNETPLVVFFPTEKETHLGFLAQGPYRTTPARDNVPIADALNRMLIAETASLVVASLFTLRQAGLLTVGFLDALPIRPVDFPPGSMFRPIFAAVRDALRTQPLLPTDDGGYTIAREAKLARGAGLLDLFRPHQLGDLLGRTEPVYWLNGAITENRTPDLYRYLMGPRAVFSGFRRPVGEPPPGEPLVEDLEVRPEIVARALTPPFLARQDDAWLCRLYALFLSQRDLWPLLRERPLLRLEDGSHVAPCRPDGTPAAHLPPDGPTDYPIVSRSIAADPDARRFLVNLGLREPDLLTEVTERILPVYERDGSPTLPEAA